METQKRSFFIYFLSLSKDRIVSADKMMNGAKGPVWHKNQKDQGIILKGLRGVDKSDPTKFKLECLIYLHVSEV